MKKPVYWFLLVLGVACLLAVVAAREPGALEMKVRRVMVDPYSNAPVVILETVADKRIVPIWIDVPEARSIALELEHVETPRPLTHDLIRNILHGIGASLQKITITDLKNNTYFAMLSVTLKGQEFQIDSRPSDAIAVALRMRAPIYASAQVLAKAKQLPSEDKGNNELHKTLGVQVQDLTPDLASLLDPQIKHGVLVADVAGGSIAAGAGIQRGDIVTRAGEKEIHKVADLEALLQVYKGKEARRLKLEIIRKGRPTTVVIDLPF